MKKGNATSDPGGWGEPKEVANLVVPDQTFAPLGNLVAVKVLEFEVTKLGIAIPDVSRGKYNESRPTGEFPKAVVVATGPLCKFVRRGDVVLINGQWGKGEHRGVEVRMAPEHQVVGIEPPEGGQLPRFRVVDWETGEVERCDGREIGGDVEVDENKMREAFKGVHCVNQGEQA